MRRPYPYHSNAAQQHCSYERERVESFFLDNVPVHSLTLAATFWTKVCSNLKGMYRLQLLASDSRIRCSLVIRISLVL